VIEHERVLSQGRGLWPRRRKRARQPVNRSHPGQCGSPDKAWRSSNSWRTIPRWARDAFCVGPGMTVALRTFRSRFIPGLSLVVVSLVCPGCAALGRKEQTPPPPPRVFVLAPVLNLTGGEDFDPLKVTDLIASELVSFESVSVVPVNLTLAELVRQGKDAVETPADALELARTFGADGTIVVAVTEYAPYNPPVLGLVLQYYPLEGTGGRWQFDAASASRAMTSPEVHLSATMQPQPMLQIQRVFNGADEELQEDIRAFAKQRGGDGSPHGWKKYLAVQELYVRFASASLIKTMLWLDANDRARVGPSEAQS
jgi:hypothetical protein